jgi:glycyl-tRNA synthetase beta subunit
MAELLLELFCEEIPARMQARAAEDLCTLVEKALAGAGLATQGVRGFYGPRRIGVAATVAAATEAKSEAGTFLSSATERRSSQTNCASSRAFQFQVARPQM